MSTSKIEVSPAVSKPLERLKAKFKIEENKISWDAIALDHEVFEIASYIRNRERLDDHLVLAAIEGALGDWAKGGILTEGAFVVFLRKRLAALELRPPKRFHIICQINVRPYQTTPTRLRSIYGPLEILPRLQRKRSRAVLAVEDWIRDRFRFDADFAYISTSVKATDAQSAIGLGEENIAFALGAMNIAFDSGSRTMFRMGYPSAPIGRFFRSSASVGFDLEPFVFNDWLIEGDFPDLYKRNFIAKPPLWERVPLATQLLIDGLKKTDFSEKVVGSVVSYQQAMSARDIDLTLVRLWRIFELICTQEGGKDSTDAIIKRASIAFRDPIAAIARIKFIADLRNQTVHRGGGADLILQAAQWAKVYAAGLIRFAVSNREKLRTHRDLLDFMSTTDDMAARKRQRRLLGLRDALETRARSQ